MTTKKAFGEYFLGLDIGTDSIGWAVTDLSYELQKLNGKALWGIRLFEAGKTAAERRIFRTARRRLARRKQRIKLLQDMFAEEIGKVDQGFFLRLAESRYHPDDKKLPLPYTLFSDKTYTDKDYHKAFPTIFHLRKALIEKKERFDIRLVYLAIHHIIKNRGHFLFEGQSMSNIPSFSEAFQYLQQSLRDELELDFSCLSVEEVEKTLLSREMRKSDKKAELIRLFDANARDDESKQKQAFISLVLGTPVKIDALFPELDLEEADTVKIDFSSGKFEEEYDQLAALLGDKILCIDKFKAIYDWALLAEIRKNARYLSEGKTRVYDKHKSDLQTLKLLVKTYLPKKYSEVFKNPTVAGNYCSYAGVAKKGGRKIVVEKRCDQDAFYKFIGKILKELPKDVNQPVLQEIENRTFLPKQVTTDNSVIPYQMHLEELSIILENASDHYPFLNQVDNTGFSVRQKIELLMQFRIPYYVGPLNTYHKENGGHCWAERKQSGAVRPWNFEQMVDVDKSAEAFIKRMTGKCTYLIGADVLPKNSLLYSEFMVLNELNNLKINGSGIPVGLKQRIFNELFLVQKKVTMRRLREFLENEGEITSNDDLSGIDGDFKSSMASYHDLKRILASKAGDVNMVENLIRWIVLFGDDSKLLKRRIESFYRDKLSESEIRQLAKLRYSGWGRLSKEFLVDVVHVDKTTGECVSIISALRGDLGENLNLMQLLSGRFDYLQAIARRNEKTSGPISGIGYDAVKELYVSPAVKRGIWQTMLIVAEVAKIMQHPPKKVFVEVAREEGEKKRTRTRQSILLDLYKKCRDDSREWAKELQGKSDAELRSDRLYLYYLQMGRCMYSGESIDLLSLFDEKIYDVDHIFPRSKVKDDSLENRVLVKRVINAEKSDVFPLPEAIRQKNSAFWRSLYEKGFIGKKKFDRLTRATGFSDDELADFIARQLVETRQSTKAVAEMLKRVFPQTEIVYVKAGNVSDFRHKFDLVKVREINDFHHARDAYLNIVIGNVYNTRFTHSPLNFIREREGKNYNLRKIYDSDVVRNGVIAWKTTGDETITRVKRVMQKNNILFTRYAIARHGGLFDQNIMKKGKGQLPVKGSDSRLTIEKYGGYNNVAGACFMLVEHDTGSGKKARRSRTIEVLHIHIARKISSDKKNGLDYCVNELGLCNPRILLPAIKINTLFIFEGARMHLAGRSEDRLEFRGAHQLCVCNDSERYIKKILKYQNRCREARRPLTIDSHDGITSDDNLKLYDVFCRKLNDTVYRKMFPTPADVVKKGREKFVALSLIDQCGVLENILCLFKCGKNRVDLSSIGGASNTGTIRRPKKLDNLSVVLLNQSVTGVFEQIVDLQKIGA